MGSTFAECDREKYKEICSKVLRKPKYVCFASFPLQSRLNILLYVMLLEISIKSAVCHAFEMAWMAKSLKMCSLPCTALDLDVTEGRLQADQVFQKKVSQDPKQSSYDIPDPLTRKLSTQTKIPLSEIHQILVQESLERISKNQGVTFDSLTDIN